MRQISLQQIIGKGYADFWTTRQRYRICKGSRGSKKSFTTAYWYIIHMMLPEFKDANLLVVRQVFKDHQDSTYRQLKQCINKLGVSEDWKCTVNPLRITYKPNGNSIIFKGMDDPESITSITVEKGYLCWLWCEEAYQIKSFEGFKKLNESIRGQVPDPYFLQTTLTFNPWSKKTWLYEEFWKRYEEGDPAVFFKTTDYRCNEFLDEQYVRDMERMKEREPRRYEVAGLGNWGIEEGQIYTNWEEKDFDPAELMAIRKGNVYQYKPMYGIDFGFSQDPTAFIALLVDRKNRKLYVYDEFYEHHLDLSATAKKLREGNYDRVRILADNNPSTIHELKKLGIRKIKAAKKGPGSIEAGIRRLQDYDMIIHPKCINTIMELANYVWEKKDDELTSKPVDDMNHIMDAMRYATEELGLAKYYN